MSLLYLIFSRWLGLSNAMPVDEGDMESVFDKWLEDDGVEAENPEASGA